MGQLLPTPASEINERIEDVIWNDKDPISSQALFSKFDGMFITSDEMNEVVKRLQAKEEEHYKQSMFFLRNSCMALSDHHNALWHRYHTAKYLIIHAYIDPKC